MPGNKLDQCVSTKEVTEPFSTGENRLVHYALVVNYFFAPFFFAFFFASIGITFPYFCVTDWKTRLSRSTTSSRVG